MMDAKLRGWLFQIREAIAKQPPPGNAQLLEMLIESHEEADAEIGRLKDRIEKEFAITDKARSRIASLEAALTSERTEHDAALAELTRSHTVVELEAQAEIERLEAEIEAERGRAEKAERHLRESDQEWYDKLEAAESALAASQAGAEAERAGVMEMRSKYGAKDDETFFAFVARLAADRSEARPRIRILFDGPPGPVSGHFVEVENEEGESIDAGTWTDEDGIWVLTIPAPTNDELAFMRERDAALAKIKVVEEKASDIESDYDDLHEVVETLRADIDEHLPAYVLDDGTDEEANYRERIEYAGDEIKRHSEALAAALARAETAEALAGRRLTHLNSYSRDELDAALARAETAEADSAKMLDEWETMYAGRECPKCRYHVTMNVSDDPPAMVAGRMKKVTAAARVDAVREFAEWAERDEVIVEDETHVEAAARFLARKEPVK